MTNSTPVFFTKRFLPGPVWAHFLVLGLLLHLALVWLFPEPMPTLGPPSTARLDLVAKSFSQLTGRAPAREDMERFIDMELRDELLFKEGLKLGLHDRDPTVEQRLIRNMRFLDPASDATDAELVERAMALNQHLTDEVIRRRIVQVMSQLITAGVSQQTMTESDLREAYARRQSEFVAPARVSFSHVFLGDVSSARAAEILALINSEGLPPQAAVQYGTAFLSGFDFMQVRWGEVDSRFGSEFTGALRSRVEQGAALSSWIGAVASVFGQHLIYLHHYEEERPQEFNEVVDQLRWDLKTAREQEALDAAVRAMMTRYEVRRQ